MEYDHHKRNNNNVLNTKNCPQEIDRQVSVLRLQKHLLNTAEGGNTHEGKINKFLLISKEEGKNEKQTSKQPECQTTWKTNYIVYRTKSQTPK